MGLFKHAQEPKCLRSHEAAGDFYELHLATSPCHSLPKETKQSLYSLDICECLNRSAIKYFNSSRSHACLNNSAIKHPTSYAGYFPRISMFPLAAPQGKIEILGKQNELFPKGAVIKCLFSPILH